MTTNLERGIHSILQMFWAVVGLSAILLSLYFGFIGLPGVLSARSGLEQTLATQQLMLAGVLMLVGQFSSGLVRQLMD
jgi:hypothetical protein